MAGFAILPSLLPGLLRGALITVAVTILAAALALVLSFVVGLMRLAPSRIARTLATAYVEVLRGTSALVQLFYLFYILPLFGVRLDPFTTAVVGLGMNFSSYGSEIVRSAILGVDRGQWEAARALDMPAAVAMRRIILPQAAAAMLPPFGNLLIELLKSTSLVSLITLTDLTFAGSRLIVATGKPGVIWLLVLGFYFLMAFPLSRGLRRIERRMTVYRAS
jgi:polar amino acid transport system permease protein